MASLFALTLLLEACPGEPPAPTPAAAGSDADACTPTVWYADVDGDGFGDRAVHVERCDRPWGYVADGTDCNPMDETILGEEGFCVDWFADADEDGFAGTAAGCHCYAPSVGAATTIEDCDDTDPAIHPGAPEDCDTPEDDDCDGEVNPLAALHCVARFVDQDGDGHGGGAAAACVCAPSQAYPAVEQDDCDDYESDVWLDCPATVEHTTAEADATIETALLNQAFHGVLGASGESVVVNYTTTRVFRVPEAGESLIDADAFALLNLSNKPITIHDVDGDGHDDLVTLVTRNWGDEFVPGACASLVTFAGPLDGYLDPDEGIAQTPAWSSCQYGVDRPLTTTLLGDIDGTGSPSVAMNDGVFRQVSLGESGVSDPADYPQLFASTDIHALYPPGDVDGDGMDDLATWDGTDCRVFSSPVGATTVSTDAAATVLDLWCWSSGALADFDGDGLTDVFAHDVYIGGMVVFLSPLAGDATADGGDVRFLGLGNPRAMADRNASGRADVVFEDNAVDRVFWMDDATLGVHDLSRPPADYVAESRGAVLQSVDTLGGAAWLAADATHVYLFDLP